jgi:diaminopimelate decarboxylase
MSATATTRELWPAALTVSPAGRLELDGCDLAELARDRGTPLWAISRSTVEGNFDRILGAFRERYARCEIAYSMKAHNTLAVIRLLHRRGAKIDASAEYEFQLALAAGVPPGDIILNGNGKSAAALETAARLGIRQVNLDSLDEVRRLEAIAADLGTRVRCLVRVQLTYRDLLAEDPSFESTLRIGEGKFGSNLGSGQALETVEGVLASPHLELLGLSHHVGFSGYMGDYTPEREVMHHRACTRELCAFANELRRRHGLEVQRLDLGGGFRGGPGVLLSTPGAGADVAAHPLPAIEDYAAAIFDTLEQDLDVSEPPLVQFETGGYQIADAVLLLAEVSEVKDVRTDPPRRYVVVDGSMMMFVARGMMRVGHPVVPVVEPLRDAVDVPVDVVGQTCVYDSVAEDIRLPDIAPGDVLALLHQGAYCETESTQFNGFPRPEVVLLHEGRALTVKRRETIADVHARDIVPAELWTQA